MVQPRKQMPMTDFNTNSHAESFKFSCLIGTAGVPSRFLSLVLSSTGSGDLIFVGAKIIVCVLTV